MRDLVRLEKLLLLLRLLVGRNELLTHLLLLLLLLVLKLLLLLLLELLHLLLGINHAHHVRLIKVGTIGMVGSLLGHICLPEGFLDATPWKKLAVTRLIKVRHLECHARIRILNLSPLIIQNSLGLGLLRLFWHSSANHLLLHFHRSLDAIELGLILIELLVVPLLGSLGDSHTSSLNLCRSSVVCEISTKSLIRINSRLSKNIRLVQSIVSVLQALLKLMWLLSCRMLSLLLLMQLLLLLLLLHGLSLILGRVTVAIMPFTAHIVFNHDWSL